MDKKLRCRYKNYNNFMDSIERETGLNYFVIDLKQYLAALKCGVGRTEMIKGFNRKYLFFINPKNFYESMYELEILDCEDLFKREYYA